MTSHRKRLGAFLLEKGVPQKKVDTAMSLVEQFFLIAEGKRKLLTPQKMTTEAATLAALQGMFGQDNVREVALISEKNPLPKPEWMREAVRNELMKKSVKDIWDTLLATVGRYTLGNTLRGTFWRTLDKTEVTLTDNLRNMIRETFKAARHTRGDALEDTLFFYFGFLLAGDGHEDQLRKLEAMLVVMAKGCLPLGFNEEGPTTCIAMVA